MVLHEHIKKYSYILRLVLGLGVVAVFYKGAYALWGEHYLTFFKGVLKHPLQVGAFSPCTTFVADAITKYIQSDSEKKLVRVLEVGGGSGVFTTKLESLLNTASCPYHVDVIEIDPEYVDLLQKRFAANDCITIHNHNILDWKPYYNYDYIISSLPFTNMKTKEIEAILSAYTHMIVPNGIISYIEHMWLSQLKAAFLSAQQKKEYKKKCSAITIFKERFVFETVPVWANITPVYVHHLRITK